MPAASFLTLRVFCFLTRMSASPSLLLYLAVGENWHQEDAKPTGTKPAFSRRGKVWTMAVPGFPVPPGTSDHSDHVQ